MGDSRSDLEVWRRAASAVCVDVAPSVASAAVRCTRIEARLGDRGSRPLALIRALRLHQWCKNLLVFVPILTSGVVLEWTAWLKGVVMFFAFSAAASAIYVFNDLADLQADRGHPRKCTRPFASGSLQIACGLVLSPLLLGSGILLGAAAGAWPVVALYAACSLAYSMTLKSFPLVDLFTLATLYSLRLIGGGVVTGHPVSMWLLAFSTFMFLSLAAVKRVSELQDVIKAPRPGFTRRGYGGIDVAMVTMLGVASAFSSSIVLALYVQSRNVVPVTQHLELMWAIVPLMLFWQCRLWLATGRGYMHDDPIVYAAKDWVSWVTAACVVVVFLLSTVGRVTGRGW
jgi:4-hydroxybenzoate polyprenyltransferase